MGAALDRTAPFRVISNYGTGGDPKKRGVRTSDQPSATVTGKVLRNRVVMRSGAGDRFSLAEAGRLQTFPRDYPWSGRDCAQQIGRRVVEESLDDAVDRSWKDADVETPLVRTESVEDDRLPVG
jgi:DNA (cytosine-5)-methyltransferase 1